MAAHLTGIACHFGCRAPRGSSPPPQRWKYSEVVLELQTRFLRLSPLHVKMTKAIGNCIKERGEGCSAATPQLCLRRRSSAFPARLPARDQCKLRVRKGSPRHPEMTSENHDPFSANSGTKGRVSWPNWSRAEDSVLAALPTLCLKALLKRDTLEPHRHGTKRSLRPESRGLESKKGTESSESALRGFPRGLTTG